MTKHYISDGGFRRAQGARGIVTVFLANGSKKHRRAAILAARYLETFPKVRYIIAKHRVSLGIDALTAARRGFPPSGHPVVAQCARTYSALSIETSRSIR